MIKLVLQTGETVQFSETWPLRRIEWMLSLALLGIGFTAAVQGEVASLPMYDYLSKMLPLSVWAGITIAIGALRLLFLYWNGAYRRSPHFRALGAGMGCLVWLALSVSLWVSPVAGLTVVIWPLFFVFDLHNALSAAGEAARSDVRAAATAAAHQPGGGEDVTGVA